MLENETKEESFAELLEANPQTRDRKFAPGETVSGKVIKISKDTVFVDLGGKSEGIADAQEFLKEDQPLKEGDWISMRVASVRDGILLTKGIKAQGEDALEILRDARENLIPVDGRVLAVKKGGFEIDFSGTHAFCPLSQIDIPFCERPEEHVGAKYPFRIVEIKEKGRNIVVSRRVLLEEEREKRLRETLAKLYPGLECEGRVTKLTNFGAFVDLGGVEGMVHVSEISRKRIGHPSEILKPGQEVRVKVVKIGTDQETSPKISLSMKTLEPDPWEKGVGFEEGEIIRGRISRLTDFGAFVEVADGVDGLVHISEIGYERISHPSKVLHEGDWVDVLVLGIDSKAHRISLSIKEAAIKKRIPEEGIPEEIRLEVGQVLRGIVEEIKPYGLFVRLPELKPKTRGLLPVEELKESERADIKRKFTKGTEIRVEIVSIDEKGRLLLSQRTIEERRDREDYEKFLGKGSGKGLGTLGDLFKDLKLG